MNCFTESLICGNKNIHLYNESQTHSLYSPFYPKPYLTRYKCVWYVFAYVDTGFITFTFVEFFVKEYYDKLEIGEGSYESYYTKVFSVSSSDWFPSSVTVNSTSAWVSFKSGYYEYEGRFHIDINLHQAFGK